MNQDNLAELRKDPLKLGKVLWPQVEFYKQQRMIIYSVWEDDRTVVPAGHMLGKDFVAGFICLAFFLTRQPCRVVTTSVDYSQLEGVLWGEIRRFIQSCRFPLEHYRGGPLVVNHMHIRKALGDGWRDRPKCGISYLTGRVAAQGEGMSGHHVADVGDGIPRTLGVSDEASGVDPVTFDKMTEWANRLLVIGNPYECNNQFKHDVKGKPGSSDRGGDMPRTEAPRGWVRGGVGSDGGAVESVMPRMPVLNHQGTPTAPYGYHRRVIQIRGEDSPNVRLALMEVERGLEPSGKLVLPGILPYDKYTLRLNTWDVVKICVGIKAEFWEGPEILMFPPLWLNRAEDVARRGRGMRGRGRKAKAIGIDTAEGGDKTAMVAVDEYGVLEVDSILTPDTSIIPGRVIAFAQRWKVMAENWLFDRGGGGKQHADYLRQQGYEGIRTIGFGESARVGSSPHGGSMRVGDERLEMAEQRYTYLNMRAQMYGQLMNLLDPMNQQGFGIPEEYPELRRQLAPIPKWYDGHGRLFLPPKHKHGSSARASRNGGGVGASGNTVTMDSLIGCSPDEADALVLAVHGMLYEPVSIEVGAMR